MAYISQEKKKRLAPKIKEVLKKYDMKGTIAVNNHSTLVVNLKSGRLDLMECARKHISQENISRGFAAIDDLGGHHQVNPYWCVTWAKEVGEYEIANFYEELILAMKGDDWYDRSDIQYDYFDIAYYIDINVGQWNKDYILEKKLDDEGERYIIEQIKELV
jgi:hypothetical protein